MNNRNVRDNDTRIDDNESIVYLWRLNETGHPVLFLIV